MTIEELESFLDERTFTPFVITTVDGFALPVRDPHKTLVGLSLLIVKHTDGRIYHIPLRAIAHISETGTDLG